MGSTIASDQKMMFFPTLKKETHRLLALLGKVSLEYYKRELIIFLIIMNMNISKGILHTK